MGEWPLAAALLCLWAALVLGPAIPIAAGATLCPATFVA